MSNKQTRRGFHWGHGIILTFVLFGAFMAYFYINMSHESIELVGENYYDDGQAYQAKINLQNQRVPPEHEIHVNSIANKQFLLIQLPSGCTGAEVHYFRPSQANLDTLIQWNSNTSLTWTSSSSFLIPGPWKRTIRWTVKGKNYLQEDRL